MKKIIFLVTTLSRAPSKELLVLIMLSLLLFVTIENGIFVEAVDISTAALCEQRLGITYFYM